MQQRRKAGEGAGDRQPAVKRTMLADVLGDSSDDDDESEEDEPGS